MRWSFLFQTRDESNAYPSGCTVRLVVGLSLSLCPAYTSYALSSKALARLQCLMGIYKSFCFPQILSNILIIFSFDNTLSSTKPFIHTLSLTLNMLVANLLFGSLALGLARASALPEAKLQAINPRQSGSCNTATNRQCWSDGFDVKTDSEIKWPTPPPNQRTYNLVISEQTLSPFGTPKSMLVINGSYPGPAITAGKLRVF